MGRFLVPALLCALCLAGGCASHESRVDSATRTAMRLAGRGIQSIRDLDGKLPEEAAVWGELWRRRWIIDQPPCFQVIHDPHRLQVFDYWERPLRYEVESGKVVLTSGGPNRRIGDEDDLVEVVTSP